MKKLFAVILMLFIGFTLVSCDDPANPNNPNDNTQQNGGGGVAKDEEVYD